MNITQIIQKKFPKFTKEKYSDLFEEIIRAALNPVSAQKVESITCDILNVKSKKKKKQSGFFKESLSLSGAIGKSIGINSKLIKLAPPRIPSQPTNVKKGSN